MSLLSLKIKFSKHAKMSATDNYTMVGKTDRQGRQLESSWIFSHAYYT
jgi:hypothetical protein